MLQEKEEYEATSKKMRAVGLTAKVIATYETSSEPKLTEIETEEILDEMLERLELERPEMVEPTKDDINRMDPEGKQRFAAFYKRSYRNQKNALKKDGPKTQKQHKQA